LRAIEMLPRPAPADPLPLAQAWLDDAVARIVSNPWAMALATTAATGRPSVRYVLLKSLSKTQGFLVFYTNYSSRKAVELDTAGHAAGVLYWPETGRQLRFEGRVERSPAGESDAYFASRPRQSQLNAWASQQSQPIASPDLMRDHLAKQAAAFAGTVSLPRPDRWGGYRLHIDAIEFWTEGTDRFHERLRYERAAGRHWSSDWLQP
jgi:pyridoxamine 5'-phosphate oxidase